MSETQAKKSSRKTLIIRAIVPLVIVLGISAFVYYLSMQDRKKLEESQDQVSSIQVKRQESEVNEDSLSAPQNEAGIRFSEDKKTVNLGIQDNQVNASDLPPSEIEKPLDEFSSARLFEQIDPAMLSSDLKESKNIKKHVLFSDFIVRARTGLPFEGALLRLDHVLEDSKVKKQLRKLLPYALEGLGNWPVLMRDLDKVLDRGVHTKAKPTDPWIVHFVKSFFHVRKKSVYADPLREALENKEWFKAFNLTDKLIAAGFPLKKWKVRLERYVKGRALLTSFFLMHQKAGIIDN
jgi:hypothetical protein